MRNDIEREPNIVRLDDDVAELFPNSEKVNEGITVFHKSAIAADQILTCNTSKVLGRPPVSWLSGLITLIE